MTILVAALLIRECRGTINLAKRLGVLSLCVIFNGWCISIATFVEKGFFEGMCLLTFVAECLCAALSYNLFLAFVIPLCTIYRIPHHRIRGYMKKWTVLMCGPFFCFFVTLIYYCRRSNTTFNWAQAAHCLFILVANVIFVSILIVQSHNLTQVLGSLSHSNMPSRRLREVQRLERRTKMMTAALIVYLVIVVTTVTSLVTMVLTIGSALYGWVFGFIIAHFSLILGTGVAVFLKQHRDNGDRSSIGIVVDHGEQASDVPGDDYKSWTKTNTVTATATAHTKYLKKNESGVHKGMLSGLGEGEESETPITQTSDDGGDPKRRMYSGNGYQPSAAAESDRVVRRDRAGVVASSLAPSLKDSSIVSVHDIDPRPRSRAKPAISGMFGSTLSSKRGDAVSVVSVFDLENAVVEDHTRSSQRKKRDINRMKSHLESTVSRVNEAGEVEY